MVAIAPPSVLVCSVTAVTSSNRVTSRLIVRPSVADSGSLLLCPQLHRARRDGCCTRDAAIADPRRLIEHGGQLVKKEELLRAAWADKGIAVRIGVYGYGARAGSTDRRKWSGQRRGGDDRTMPAAHEPPRAPQGGMQHSEVCGPLSSSRSR